MSEHTTLLIVDDEADIRQLVRRYFERQGFAVAEAGSGQEMRSRLARQPADVVLLDICLPDISGVELLSEIKSGNDCAVIMLTAQGSTEQRIDGLNRGADDYLPKPFDLAELHARIKAVLRRGTSQAADKSPEQREFRFAGYRLDGKTRSLLDPTGKAIELTPAEYDLLLVLIKNPGTVLDRDYLMLTTRGRPATAHDRAIDVRIGQLRKKLPRRDASAAMIATVRGGGYMLDCEVEVS